MTSSTPPRTIEWIGGLDGHVAMIDQTLLPGELLILDIRDRTAMFEAIRRLSVRGAPAIGIAAAMGSVLGVRDFDGSAADFQHKLDAVCGYLAESRPTAVNLFWALDRMRACARANEDTSLDELKLALLDEARLIRDEDAAMCRAIGTHGVHLLEPGAGVLTHCNAGALATAEYGTALAPIYLAHERGIAVHVFADETRPLLQGSRLTAWELSRAGIDVTVLCDNAAASLMREGKIDLVIMGADRIAANGDVANKIGTYGVALMAQAHEIPFYVAAPSSTFDMAMADGSGIPIEQRDPKEVSSGFGSATTPPGVACHNPAFDVTPARLIAGLITERGLIQPVTTEAIAATLS